MSIQTRKGRLSLKGSLDTLAKLNLTLSEFLPIIYEYNNTIRHTGYYLKPVHVTVRKLDNGTVVKYYYYGRYWYKLEKIRSTRIRWIYVGREKPRPELPDPPPHPLEGVVVKKYDGQIEIEFASEELFRELSKKLYHV